MAEVQTQAEWKASLLEMFCDYDYTDHKRVLRSDQKAEVEASLKGAEVLFEGHDADGCYEDSILVVYAREGKLFVVRGGHCSCNGFEGQWSESEVTVEWFQTAFAAKDAGKYESDISFLSTEDYEQLKEIIQKRTPKRRKGKS